MWDWHGGWWWLTMGPVMALFWALVIWLLVSYARPGGRGDGSRSGDAERILAERYARGELDGDEYRRRLEDLRR